MAVTKKEPFLFSATRGVDVPIEERNAIALEFIAHYLDRIDHHLEQLVAAVQSGNGNSAQIAQNVAQVAFVAGKRP